VILAQLRSGGQTGVDIASLRAAKSMGVPTGGTMPRGFKTLAGKKPEWAAEFGLTEDASAEYPPRTRANVRIADVTVRIAANFMTRGEVCTLKAIKDFGKPEGLDIGVRRVAGLGLVVDSDDIFRVAERIVALSRSLGRPVILNVAGNSEQTCPEIEAFAEGVVKMLIDAIDAESA
jgi:hypothetical protein